MAILNNCELWFAKLDPKRPNAKFNKERPTWELQIRTFDKAVKKNWEEIGLKVKTIDPDDGPIYYRVNLRKKSIKDDGTPASPVEVINGKHAAVDPNSIGNGSVGNVKVFMYEYTPKGSKETSLAPVLMGVQLTKHIVFKPKPREDGFGEAETETIDQQAESADDSSDGEY